MSEPDLAITENGRERGKRLRTQRIISAARQLIHERPNQPPTIPEVAARAGVAPMTIFNLIGNRDDLWAALADESLADWQSVASGVADPHKRAHKIVDEVMRIISEEAPVFRALISGWRDSGRVLERDPSRALVACLQQAADEGRIAAGLDVRRLGAMIFSGLVGIVHQWAAGLIGDRAMRRRARDLVDIAFAAGRPDNTSPTWDLGSG
jgi:AcrR family transcriptional regulator